MKEKLWHTQSIESIFEKLATSPQGLSDKEAARRLQKYGYNILPEAKPRSAFMRFFSQFHNILIYVLIVAGVIAAFLGEHIDAGVIFGVVFINALIGYFQEGKAENALLAIKKMLSPTALILRDGHTQVISAQMLVVGDIVFLKAGDKVPAGLRLFTCKDLHIQESILTGESVPVNKNILPAPSNSPLGDRFCMAYAGTLVTRGEGTGVVVATGLETQIGHISQMVSHVQSVTTPLLKQMDAFGRWLTIAILGVASLTFCFGVFIQKYTVLEMYLAAVSLAVAAIPEGLPAIMTITLAIGVQRMVSRNAIIRKLPAVETLGAVSVICTDKTGTLTRNEMTVRSIITFDESPNVQTYLARAALLCNNATYEYIDEAWTVRGDPMEEALLFASIQAGLIYEDEMRDFPRYDTIAFDAQHRFMATLNKHNIYGHCIFIKGAPEKLLTMCSWHEGVRGKVPLDSEYWNRQIQALATQGQRVLALAYQPLSHRPKTFDFETLNEEMIFLGLVGLIDPPREEAIEAVSVCQKAGIRVIMITGDHATTAQAIAKQIGLANTHNVCTGEMLDEMDDATLKITVQTVDVYARVTPAHKLLLVQYLQKDKLIVAMTGDGVNDAPALKRADIGIAMGDNGSEVAKEAAEMVLTDDNFASICAAIEEGRTVYDNLKKSILFILPSSSGEALIVIAAIVFGFAQLPLTPIHILWVNMITTVTLALVLAFEPTEKNVMNRPPHKASEPMLSPLLMWRILFVAIILMVGTFGLFIWEIEQGRSLQYARTIAVNTLVVFEIFYLFNSRYIIEPVLNKKGFTGNIYALIAIIILILFQLAFTYTKPMQLLFNTVSIEPISWIKITLVASSVLFLVEIEKFFIRKKRAA